MDRIEEVMITREEIAETVKELGKRLSEDYKGKNLLMVGVSKGGIVFFADLLREVTIRWTWT